MTEIGKFYWLNLVNHVECGGPFDTKHAARENALATYERVQSGVAMAVALLTVEEVGRVETSRPRWVADGGEQELSAEFTIAGPGGSMYPRRGHAAQRPTSDGVDRARAVDSPLWPWRATKDQFSAIFAGRAGVAGAFYRAMGTDGHVLEPVVERNQLPRELAHCYDLVSPDLGPTYWLIRINDVPAELRDQFPRLKPDRNQYEYDVSASWQRPLYSWSDADQKWVLIDAAWGRET